MKTWETKYYEVPAVEDALWDAALEELPEHFSGQIGWDFGVGWVAELSDVEASRMVLAIGRHRIHSLGGGVLTVPDCYRAEFLDRLSESTEHDCRWTRLRRIHFATAAAQAAFEALP